jgi:hypothetical protein
MAAWFALATTAGRLYLELQTAGLTFKHFSLAHLTAIRHFLSPLIV